MSHNKIELNWRKFLWNCCLVFLFISTFLLTNLAKINANSNQVLLGIYSGSNGFNNMSQIQALEAWQGKKHAVVNVFTTWCPETTYLDSLFLVQLIEIWQNQNVPLITFQPFACHSKDTPADIELRAANGEYDLYLHNWSDRMKTFLSGADGIYNTADDRRAYIRFAHEMNGDWYAWSALPNGTHPVDYIRMWQRVKSLFYNKGMEWTHLQWIWTVNFTDNGYPTMYPAESYYPGDDYVDWVSISGYNWGVTQWWSKWITPEQTFQPMLDRLRRLTNKPVAITEIGSTTETSQGINIAAKSGWIIEAFNYILSRNIKMVVWFNEAKETDWAIFGSPTGDSTFNYNGTTYNTYSTYKSAVSPSSILSTDPTNPRLLTDAQFAGQ
jgi:beta-mannanase